MLDSVIVGTRDPANDKVWKYKDRGSRDLNLGYKDIKVLYEVISS